MKDFTGKGSRLIRFAAAASILCAGIVSAHASFAQAAVNTTDDLAAAIQSAKPGAVLELAGGDYGALALKRAGGAEGMPVTVRSADPANPARLTGMDLREVNDLVFDGLVFDYDYQQTDKPNQRPFQVFTARGLTIRNSLFDGDIAESESPDEEAYPSGFGLVIRSSANLIIENNEIRDFYRGMVVSDVVDAVIRGNDIHSIRMDGMNFAQVERVVIEKNYIHDFKRAVDSSDHADMIQFWTSQTDRPSTDITIRDNVLNSGLGWFTQSIFMRNEQVDTGSAGPEMFYRNITIENNVIINAHAHGITVGETNGLVIRNNSVLRNARSEGKKPSRMLWVPQIWVAPTSTQVEITKNVAGAVNGYDQQQRWVVSGNFIVQDKAATEPGFYDAVFVAARTGNPQNLGSFQTMPGGPLDAAGIGSSLLGGSDAQTMLKTLPDANMRMPAIRTTVDPTTGNRFTFDASLSAGLEGIKTADATFEWAFGDGKTAQGPVVTHIFGKPGLYRIEMTLRVPGQEARTSSSTLRVPGEDVVVFSSVAGTFTSYAVGEDPVIADLPLSKGPAELGRQDAVLTIDRSLIAPFFGSNAFSLSMRLRSSANYKNAGELLRIPKTIVVNINERGMIDVRFDTATASQLRLYGGPVKVYSGQWVDLTFRYSAITGIFQVEADGAVISEGKTSGLIRPLEHWGLSLGNPFNNKKSFDGELDSLVLKVGNYNYATTE